MQHHFFRRIVICSGFCFLLIPGCVFNTSGLSAISEVTVSGNFAYNASLTGCTTCIVQLY